jgi:hypothetical protein
VIAGLDVEVDAAEHREAAGAPSVLVLEAADADGGAAGRIRMGQPAPPTPGAGHVGRQRSMWKL